jgi:hypothetical protein
MQVPRGLVTPLVFHARGSRGAFESLGKRHIQTNYAKLSPAVTQVRAPRGPGKMAIRSQCTLCAFWRGGCWRGRVLARSFSPCEQASYHTISLATLRRFWRCLEPRRRAPTLSGSSRLCSACSVPKTMFCAAASCVLRAADYVLRAACCVTCYSAV